MPELPEVETVRKDLLARIKNLKIKNVKVDVVKMVSPRMPEFAKKVKGQVIKDIDRRGKLLIFKLTKNYILAHLKMTGQFVYAPDKGEIIVGGHPIKDLNKVPNKFTHVTFTLSKGMLYFNDVRKFGWFKYVDRHGLEKELENYGVEPLSREFTLEKFKQILESRPKKKIKQLLLEQKLIAGIGNIYADEVLFYSGVHPECLAKDLKPAEIKKMHQGIKDILYDAIKQRGTSVNTYRDVNGQKGAYVRKLKVYQCEGEKCIKCGTKIKRIKLGGRSSCFCPKCQK